MKERLRTSVVVVHQEKILTFFAVDPMSGREYHFLPGGGIEDDETAPEACIRETLEETGFQIDVDPQLNVDRDYHFTWDGDDYQCTTIFYLGFLKNPMQRPREVRDADYNKGVQWVPVSEASTIFAYTPEINEAIQELLKMRPT